MTATAMKVSIIVAAAPNDAIAAETVSGRPSGSSVPVPPPLGPRRAPTNRPRRVVGGRVAVLGSDGRLSRSVIAPPS